ncbi:MAG: histidine kinase [Saprospiraceae bacterium]|nr:histidine kinase [Candidatus Defluviibacterium haderslevense]
MLWRLAPSNSQSGYFSYPYKQLTVAQGLHDMQIRDILIDDDNYVWILTQGGLNGYDGKNIHTYQLGSIAESYMIKIIKGRNGIYGQTSSCIFHFDGIRTENLTSKLNANITNMNLLLEDKDGFIWVKSGNSLFVVMNNKLEPIECIYPVLDNLKIEYAWGNSSWDHVYILTSQNALISFSSDKGIIYNDSLTFSAAEKISYTKSIKNTSPSSINFYVHGKENFDRIYTIKNEHFIKVAHRNPNTPYLVAIDQNAPLTYVDNYNNVSSLYTLKDSIYIPADWLPVNHVRFSCTLGRNIFIGTDDGFLVINLNGLETYQNTTIKYPWSIIPFSDSSVLITTYKSGAFEVNKKGKILNNVSFPKNFHYPYFETQILSNYQILDSKILFGSGMGLYYLDKENGQSSQLLLNKAVEAFSFDKYRNTPIIGTDKIYWITQDYKGIMDSMDLSQAERQPINELIVYPDSILWSATNSGIQKTSIYPSRKHLKFYSSTVKNLPCQGAVSFAVDSNKRLWVGGTCGLLLYHPEQDTFELVYDNIIHERINQLCIGPSNILIAVSNKNIYCLNISTEHPEIVRIFNSDNGFNLYEPSENGICITDNHFVWMPSENGIQRLDINQIIQSSIKPSIKLLSIDNKSINLDPNKMDQFEVNGSSVLINFSIISHDSEKWQFKFKLNNQESPIWQQGTEILIQNLKHGINAIEIIACSINQNANSCIKFKTNIKASLPFVQRQSSYITIGLLFVLLVCIIIWYYITTLKTKQKLSQLNSDLLKNRLRTIQSYLNPHFLFNTLTTLQDYILHKDRHEGSDLIVRLSRIFRHVLKLGYLEKKNNSLQIDLINVSEELSLINDIVFLQNLQQVRPVLFKIELPENINVEHIYIPPLLIQPFIENAFKHAFTGKETAPEINLIFTMNENYLFIKIQDNGKGFDNNSISTNGTNIGIKLANERMSILNSLNIKNNITIENRSPTGTEISITIKRIQ